MSRQQGGGAVRGPGAERAEDARGERDGRLGQRLEGRDHHRVRLRGRRTPPRGLHLRRPQCLPARHLRRTSWFFFDDFIFLYFYFYFCYIFTFTLLFII